MSGIPPMDRKLSRSSSEYFAPRRFMWSKSLAENDVMA